LENVLREHGEHILDAERAVVVDQLPAHPVPYLNVKKGFTCVAPAGSDPCYRTLGQRRKIVEHQVESHADTPGFSIRPTLMQTFYLANLTRYFPIHKATEIAAGFADYWRSWVDKADAQVPTPVEAIQPRNEREQEPFFRRHGWYNVFAPYDKRQLLEIHSGQPRTGMIWESELSSLVHNYFSILHQQIPNLHPTVVQLLSQKDE
jgi:hypothetical protein